MMMTGHMNQQHTTFTASMISESSICVCRTAKNTKKNCHIEKKRWKSLIQLNIGYHCSTNQDDIKTCYSQGQAVFRVAANQTDLVQWK